LRILAEKPVNVIVSDIRMPGMDGNEFLTEVMEQYPGVIRLALSGEADEQTTLHAVRRVHQYLAKPCDADTLRATIQRICALHDLLQDERLQNLARQLKTVPSLPALYEEIVRELQSDSPSIQRVGRIISRDVGMTAKILQMVNSAFFGLRRRISDPAHAVNLLGVETIRNLVLTIHVFQSCEDSGIPASTLGALWTHSMRVGRVAKELAGRAEADTGCIEDAQGAGMLHDLGTLILMANAAQEHRKAGKLAAAAGMDIATAERHVFGSSHAEVGAYLLGLWGLANPVVEAVAFHHSPIGEAAMGFTPLTAVHVANVIEREIYQVSGEPPELDLDYLDKLGVGDCLPEWREFCAELLTETDDSDDEAA
jgi:HD-like signal output (HDOD) protein